MIRTDGPQDALTVGDYAFLWSGLLVAAGALLTFLLA